MRKSLRIPLSEGAVVVAVGVVCVDGQVGVGGQYVAVVLVV